MERMKVLLAVFVLMWSAFAVGAEKPPEPNDVPFPYDPNECLFPILDWVIVEPNVTSVYPLGVYSNQEIDPNNLEEWTMNIRTTDISRLHMPVTVDALDAVRAYGGGWIRYFQIGFTPPHDEKVYYFHLQINTPGGGYNERTLLILAEFPPSPREIFLLPGRAEYAHGVPMSYAYEGFLFHAAEVGYEVKEPVNMIQ